MAFGSRVGGNEGHGALGLETLSVPASLVLAAAFVVAASFYPATRLAPAPRRRWLVGVFILLILLPWLIPDQARVVRLVTASLCVLLGLKLVDVHIMANRGIRIDFPGYLGYLANFCSLVARKRHLEPPLSASENARSFAGGLGLMGVGFVTMQGLFLVDWREWPFLVEHLFKATGLFLGILGLFQVIAAVTRMTGARVRRPHQAPFSARTPADFWRRYNRVVQQFFHENVFKPIGGRRFPVFGTLAVFAMSGLIHEYAFSLGSGGFQGYQLTFFMLQGMVVAVTLRVKPTGWRSVPWTLGTLAFNLATSLLFLASFHRVAPLYSNPLPGWLDW